MGKHQVSLSFSVHCKGTNSIAFFAISAISHDPELFDSPELFEPERFLGERGKHPRLADFDLPFGFGRRICPGRAVAEQALFIVISRCVPVSPASFFSLSRSHAHALMCQQHALGVRFLACTRREGPTAVAGPAKRDEQRHQASRRLSVCIEAA